MTGTRDDGTEGGMDGRRGEEAEINAANARPVRGCRGIGQHVNLNPFRDGRKHTGRENKGLSGKERDVRSLSSHSFLHPLSV